MKNRPISLEERIQQADRVCFFAHYHQDSIVADHVLFYLRDLQNAGFTTIILSTAALSDAEAAKFDAVSIGLVRRENRGLDFGGWIEACQRFFPLKAEFLLFTNDSVYGPIGSFSKFIGELTAEDAAFYGAVESLESGRHLQSWFLLFRPASYNALAFRQLMLEPMPAMHSKAQLVKHYEVGLSQRLLGEGLQYRAAFELRNLRGLVSAFPFNVSHLLWREIIEAGIPFMKVELLRINPLRVNGLDDWRAMVGERAPTLVPMIEADLRQRGRSTPQTFSSSALPAVYRAEVRHLIRRDYILARNGSTLRLRLNGVIFRSITMATRPFRRVHRTSWRLKDFIVARLQARQASKADP